MVYKVFWGYIERETPTYDCEQLVTQDLEEAREKFNQLRKSLKSDWLTENACGNRNKLLFPCHDFCCELVQTPSENDWLHTETIEFAKYGYDEWRAEDA